MVRHWNTVLIFIVLVLGNDISFGYPTPVDFTGSITRWNIDVSNPEIFYTVEAEDVNLKLNFDTITDASAELWNSVSGSYLRLKKPLSGETPQITIHFDSSIAGGESSAGYAEFDESDEKGPIHCSIHIAADGSNDWQGLAKTTLHEMGHCIGLGHSLVPESIMSYQLDKNSFALALDDEAVVSRLYPKNESKSKLPPGCSIGFAALSLRSNLLIFLLFLPLIPAISPRFRK